MNKPFIVTISIIGAALIGAWHFAWGAEFWKGVLVSDAALHPYSLGFLLAGIAVGAAVFFRESLQANAKSNIALAVSALLVLGTIAAIPFQINAIQNSYLDEVETVDGTPDIDFDQRVPHAVALNQVVQNMQDSTGEPQNVRSVAGMGETGLWNTLIVRAGVGVGYESVLSIDSPAYGNVSSAHIERCYFSEDASLRFGGFFPHNNLNRAVLNAVLFKSVTFHQEDAYAYCDGDDPIVVIPLVQRENFYGVSYVPYGVATYNGTTGVLDVTRDVDEIADIPGPTYPISIAESQREALHSFDGGWWEHVQGLLGWSASGAPELQLRVADTTDTFYVTPLEPRGESQSVVAMGYVDAHGFVPGVRNDYTVYTLDESRNANGTIIDNVMNEYSWMTEFVSDRYRVYEIVPGVDGGWVASVGTDQSIIYRVIINADGTDLTLVDRNGNEITRGNATPDAGGDEGGSSVNLDLSTLSDEELVQVITEAAEELASRE